MQEYFKEEAVREATLAFFEGDTLATNVWMTKYALKSGDNYLELSPKDSINRYVKEFSRIETTYENPMKKSRIQELLEDFKYFIPAGSPMFGIGNTEELVSLANCFVVGNDEDSFGGIVEVDESLAQIMKRRGGVGIDISHLRPRGNIVKNAAKNSTGAVSFMEKFSGTTKLVAQEGRRGALMITIDVSHPDILEFISVKDDLTVITGANISVKVTDAFMEAVETDSEFDLVFPGNDPIKIKAKKVWNQIIHQAWKSAEPGILFWDTITRESPADCYHFDGFKTTCVNPCAELPLSRFDSCRLGSMNVFSHVINPFTEEAKFDWQKFYANSFDAQKLMDDMINLEEEKINAILNKIASNWTLTSSREFSLWEKIKRSLLLGRRTGLGQTGLADAGAALGLIYGSPGFIEFAESVQETLAKASYASSIQMAKDRGSFQVFDPTLEHSNPFISRLLKNAPKEVKENYAKFGRRNIANLTIAPNGSLSLLARVSSGIEPVFALSYQRRRKVTKDHPGAIKDKVGDYWEEYSVLHPNYGKYKEIGDTSAYEGSTANEIDYFAKIELQSRLQKYCDHSISVTHNLPNDIEESVVEDIYMQAWKSDCKGITVYREGSRDGVLLAKEQQKKEDFFSKDAPKRPKALSGEAFGTSIKGEKFTVIVGLLEGKPYEVFAYKGNGLSGIGEIIKIKKGTYKFVVGTREEIITWDLTEEQEAITRGYSFGLRHGGHVKFAVEQLSKTKGDLSSFNKAIARVLKRFVIDGETSSELCPECQHRLVYESGCTICHNCGWSACK